MTTRKGFIGRVLAAGVAPMVVPSTVRGANAPSNRITVGGIGIGTASPWAASASAASATRSCRR